MRPGAPVADISRSLQRGSAAAGAAVSRAATIARPLNIGEPPAQEFGLRVADIRVVRNPEAAAILPPPEGARECPEDTTINRLWSFCNPGSSQPSEQVRGQASARMTVGLELQFNPTLKNTR